MILTDREIQIALDKKQIIIDPLPSLEAYSSTTVDLTLDDHITEFREDLSDDPIETIIDPSHRNFNAERTLARITTTRIIAPDGYLLVPKKLILGWTAERIELPTHSRIAARVEGKSSIQGLQTQFGWNLSITERSPSVCEPECRYAN